MDKFNLSLHSFNASCVKQNFRPSFLEIYVVALGFLSHLGGKFLALYYYLDIEVLILIAGLTLCLIMSVNK